MIYIEGRLQTDSWEKDGIKRSTTRVIGDMFTMIGPKQNSRSNETFTRSVNQPNDLETSSDNSSNNAKMNNNEDDIDLPF